MPSIITPTTVAVEIDTIAVSLSGGFTDSDGAIAWLIEAGGLDLIAPSTQEGQANVTE
jgi:hypothetical protein